jgi:hypothetical protein
LIALELQEWHKALCFEYKALCFEYKALCSSLEEADVQYVAIWCWWYSLGLLLRVQFLSLIIGCVFGTPMWDNGGLHATCETPWLSFIICLFFFMMPIFYLSFFEKACRSLARRSLPTCQLVTYLKQSITFGCNNMGKGVDAFTPQLLIIMFILLDNVHCTWYTWMVEAASLDKGELQLQKINQSNDMS